MHKDFISNLDYLNMVGIKFKKTKRVIDFINTNDINRIKRYLPYNKNDWTSVNFDRIIKRIEFDAFLRMSIFNIASSVELTFKSILTKCIYEEYADNYIYNDVNFFINSAAQKEFKNKIKEIKNDYYKSPNDVFLKKYFTTNNVRIPISAIIQKLTFGEVIYEFINFNNKIQTKVANDFNATGVSTFITNITAAKNLRNACCHNDVLNNKKYSAMPKFTNTIKTIINYNSIDHSKLFVQLYNLKLLCLDLKVWNKTIRSISTQFKSYTKNKYIKPQQQFGFPFNWEELLKE